MNSFYSIVKKNVLLTLIVLALASGRQIFAQACTTAQGDQTAYGTGNIWIGYAYTGMNFSNYMGYVNEGSTTSMNFDEGFGGDNVTYSTNGCSFNTTSFSMRYKLKPSLTGNYTITVGGDDGYRLSVDGGTTWVINKWVDQSYATSTATVDLTSSSNLVLEYYENAGANRISFKIVQNCTGSGTPTAYGTSNVWQGHIYQGTNFDNYKGDVTEGTTTNSNFDENFGMASGSYYTNSCYVVTDNFSARYMLQKNLTYAKYVITVGGDDGYRLSLDGGSTWVINNWAAHSYTVSSYTASLSGMQNMVLEYFENTGDNRVSFSMSSTTLPVTLVSWSATAGSDNQNLLKWTATNAVNFDHFDIQRSTDGQNFQTTRSIPSSVTGGMNTDYSYADAFSYNGTVYYRLAMIDLDGSIAYSNIATLSLHGSTTARIYPTVVESGSLYVDAPAPVRQAKLEIFDMNGRKLQEKSWASLEGRVQVSVSNNATLPAGAYLARLSDGQTTLAKQMILVK